MDAQGTYKDILNSGIDFASILAQSNTDNTENVTERVKMFRSISVSPSIVSGVCVTEPDDDISDEEDELMTKLEDSSKGKIKGPLLWKYLEAARRPFMLVFLLVSIIGTQLLASSADIWASYW